MIGNLNKSLAEAVEILAMNNNDENINEDLLYIKKHYNDVEC